MAAAARVPLLLLLLVLAGCASAAPPLPAGRAAPHASHITPQPPIYPPRWSVVADFKFLDEESNALVAQGTMFQIVDSVSERFRADDIYFPSPAYVSTYDAIFITNTTDIYARLVNGSMHCVDYPQKPLPMKQNWIAQWCKYNSTVYHGATQAYRWACVADQVTWLMDTSVPEGLLIYQYTLPQPLFSVHQELWFRNFQRLDAIDQGVFAPPEGWNCPAQRK